MSSSPGRYHPIIPRRVSPSLFIQSRVAFASSNHVSPSLLIQSRVAFASSNHVSPSLLIQSRVAFASSNHVSPSLFIRSFDENYKLTSSKSFPEGWKRIALGSHFVRTFPGDASTKNNWWGKEKERMIKRMSREWQREWRGEDKELPTSCDLNLFHPRP